MYKSPLVSIVIPTYNRDASIARAVKSVLTQTCQDFEILVVNDGSTDSTARVVSAYTEVDQRVRYLQHETNRGAQAARNTGIRASRGLWVAFLDSDDFFLPTSLEVRLALARRAMVSVVHSECYVLRSGHDMALYGVRPLSGDIYHELLAAPGPLFPSLLIRRDALEKIGHLDERIVSYQEWDTVIRLARHYKFGFVSEPTFVYDCLGQDTISKNKLRDARGYGQIVHKHTLSILWHLGPRSLAKHWRLLSWRYEVAAHYRESRYYKLLTTLCDPPLLGKIMRRLRLS